MCNTNIRKDCKYYRNNTDSRGCTILKELVCRCKKCKFYKKEERYETKNTKPIYRNRSI